LHPAILILKILYLSFAYCGPGLLLVARCNWSPMEKLCGALAASFVLIYLAGFGLFCAGADPAPWSLWVASAVCAILGLT